MGHVFIKTNKTQTIESQTGAACQKINPQSLVQQQNWTLLFYVELKQAVADVCLAQFKLGLA